MSDSSSKLVFLLLCMLQLIHCKVTYDNKALVINRQRRLLVFGSIHYTRSTPGMWGDLIQKANLGGLDVVETYVFWNGDEPSLGNYYFEERYYLVQFVKIVHQVGTITREGRFDNQCY